MIKTSHQIIFWIVIFGFLNILFGIRWGNYVESFYYSSMLMPVAVGSSYFFNLFLVPKYLSKGKHFQFGLYTVYTIIISAFLTAVISMFSFITLADLQWDQMNPVSADLFQMVVVIYFIAILFSFMHTYKANELNQEKLDTLKHKNRQEIINIKSNRKSIPVAVNDILYIESLADYVKIHRESDTIITKEKISFLESSLPDWFLRIHRSFLINQHKLEAYGHDFMQVNAEKLPLGRKYKKEALSKIKLTEVNQ
ncbi:LytTR family DNA-binding domain-containing protein [Roseivirga sp. E12]|uniref:LytR/AlgR family response regulator transcription factor n=1 Tax=Roseivirga sp. E12 TaxID=2819237 RepID=UPI001ABCD951|nr:LytTR family DNA-binding domain-containing protein [Roseivirga sp. E12]MBO3698598.1 LytTR family transcriptional regulator DNA-binding domain-containing protein [Roseivirga sp. E12]